MLALSLSIEVVLLSLRRARREGRDVLEEISPKFVDICIMGATINTLPLAWWAFHGYGR